MGGLVEPWDCRYEYTVEEEHVAEHLARKGRMVLSTPCLVLMMERGARRCLDERLGITSVGYRVDVKHRSSAEPGEKIVVYARVYYWDGRRALVYVRAETPEGKLVGEGINERFRLGEE